VTKKSFADLAQVAPTLISRMVRKGKLIADADDGLDIENPVNRAYLERRKMAAATNQDIAERLAAATLAQARGEPKEPTPTPDNLEPGEPVSYLTILATFADGAERVVSRYTFDEEATELEHIAGAMLPEPVRIAWDEERLFSGRDGRLLVGRFVHSDAVLN